MSMKKCKFEDQIDNYLLNRLEGGDRDKFEEHYFNCTNCFQKIEERNDLIAAIKSRGASIFKEEPVPERKTFVPTFEKIYSFFTPRQWATAAISAALLLVAVFGILPQFRKSTPQFFLSENEVVRGESLSLISPIIDVKVVPSFFEWKQLGQDVEYKIYIYNDKLLWTASTKENRVDVPEDIKQLMVAGEKYSWQVRAFSSKGTLIAVSSKVQFQIKATE
jgi:hypothetical protein